MEKRVTSSKALPPSVVNIQLVCTPYHVGTGAGTILLLQSTFIFTTIEIPKVATFRPVTFPKFSLALHFRVKSPKNIFPA